MKLILQNIHKITLSFLLTGWLFSTANAQSQATVTISDEEWLKDLYEEGITVKNDSIFLSKEVIKIYENEVYRAAMYPPRYDWPTTLNFIQKRELKKAFWFLMNLYDVNNENKPLVLKSFITYNAYLDMKKILTSTFYTYCYTDPLVSKMVNGKPEMHSPHILEQKLSVLKEILFYLDKYKAESEKVFTIQQAE